MLLPREVMVEYMARWIYRVRGCMGHLPIFIVGGKDAATWLAGAWAGDAGQTVPAEVLTIPAINKVAATKPDGGSGANSSVACSLASAIRRMATTVDSNDESGAEAVSESSQTESPEESIEWL